MPSLIHLLPFTSISRRKRGMFYQNLSQVLDSGIPTLRSLDAMAQHMYSSRLKRVLQQMKSHIEGGGSLATAFDQFPEYFPPSEIKMLHAAEYSGVIPMMLRMTGDFLVWLSNTIVQTISGFIYPGIILFVAFVFIPVFTAMFLGGMEDVLQQILTNMFTFIATVLLVIIAWKTLKRVPGMDYLVDRFILWIPFLGKAILQIARARFARMFECTYAAGIPILEAVKVCADGCGNQWVADRLQRAVPMLKEGVPLGTAMATTKVFSPIGLGLIATGDESGKMEQTLRKLAEYEEQQAQTRINILSRVLPPMVYVAVLVYIAVTFVIPGFLSYFQQIGAGL